MAREIWDGYCAATLRAAPQDSADVLLHACVLQEAAASDHGGAFDGHVFIIKHKHRELPPCCIHEQLLLFEVKIEVTCWGENYIGMR